MPWILLTKFAPEKEIENLPAIQNRTDLDAPWVIPMAHSEGAERSGYPHHEDDLNYI